MSLRLPSGRGTLDVLGVGASTAGARDPFPLTEATSTSMKVRKHSFLQKWQRVLSSVVVVYVVIVIFYFVFFKVFF